jgi:hypothetical protein
MKYISTIAILFIIVQLKSQTCYINPSFIASPQTGLYPLFTVGISNGKVSVPYAESLTVKSKKDTSITITGSGSTIICINRYELVSPVGVTNFGLPSGLNLHGVPANFRIPADATGCVSIDGTPTAAGTYNLTFQLKRYCTAISSGTCPVPSNPNSGSPSIIPPLTYKLSLTINP